MAPPGPPKARFWAKMAVCVSPDTGSAAGAIDRTATRRDIGKPAGRDVERCSMGTIIFAKMNDANFDKKSKILLLEDYQTTLARQNNRLWSNGSR